MLPSDFPWAKPAPTAYEETVIAYGDTFVVHLYQPQKDQAWVAMLDAHRDTQERRRRPCTNFEQGRSGAEM